MRVLIIEDDENKRGHIKAYVTAKLPTAQVTEARAYRSGLLEIVAGGIDVVLLDIAMPTFDIGAGDDGGRPQPFAGREILRQMDRRGIAIPVIVVTQFVRFGMNEELTLEELDQQLRRDHGASYRGAVYYDASLAGWQRELGALIEQVCSDSAMGAP